MFCHEVSLLQSAVQNTQQPFFHVTYLQSDTRMRCAQGGQYVIALGTNICQNSGLEDLCLKMWCHFLENGAETEHPGKFPMLTQLQNIPSLPVGNIFIVFYIVT